MPPKKNQFISLGISIIVLFGIILYVNSLPNYIIDDDKVYINDSNVYLSAFPHTLKGDGFVEFELRSKTYSGNIDVALGFNKNIINPTQIQFYNPRDVTNAKSYTCNTNYFNYTLSPNLGYCYQNHTFLNNQTSQNMSELILLFSHNFTSGILPQKTIYWNETNEEFWSNLNKTFNTINYNYDNKDTWKYATNVFINANQTYRFRIFFDSKLNPFDSTTRKYDFAIKPSGETLQEAISNNHLYLLDPWVIGLESGLFAYYNCSSRLEQVAGGTYDLDEVGTVAYTSGKKGNACDDSVGLNDGWNLTNDKIEQFKFQHLGGNFTINCWVNPSGDAGDIVNNEDIHAGNNSNGWRFMMLSGPPIRAAFLNSNTGPQVTSNIVVSPSAFSMITARQNSSHLVLNVNNTDDISSVVKAKINDSGNAGVSFTYEQSNGAGELIGLFDECSFWNRTLTDSEVSTLWNASGGITRDDFFDINVSYQTPLNNSWVSKNTLFNVTTGSFKNLKNASLYGNWSTGWHLNKSLNFSGFSNSTNFTINITPDGTSQWYVTICDENSNCKYNETNLTINVDTVNPNLTIISPSGITANLTPLIELSIADVNLDSCWVNVTRADNNGSDPLPTRQITDCDIGNRTLVVPGGGTLSNSLNYIVWSLVYDLAGNSNLTWLNFTTLAGGGDGGGGGGGGGGGTIENITIIELFCGDNACTEGKEDFFSCSADCSGNINLEVFNLDTLMYNCLSEETQDRCLWFTNPGLFVVFGFVILTLVFSIFLQFKQEGKSRAVIIRPKVKTWFRRFRRKS